MQGRNIDTRNRSKVQAENTVPTLTWDQTISESGTTSGTGTNSGTGTDEAPVDSGTGPGTGKMSPGALGNWNCTVLDS